MELHLVFELRSPPGTTPHRELYPAMLDISAWADELGFSYVNFGEHHVSESGYNPSPLITCAAVAGRTRRIRTRPNVLLAPLYDPLKLAEDCAVLSLASQGRFDIVLGGGYRALECAMFGKRLEDRWAAIGAAAKVLRQAWTGEPFEYLDRTVFVRPAPDPQPKIFLGGGTVAAARRAARIADGFAVPGSPDLWEPYRQECVALGKPDPGPAQPWGPVFLWIAEDVEAAWKLLMPHVLSQIEEYNRFTVEAYGEARGPYRGKVSEESVRANPAYQVLTPEQAIALGKNLGASGRLLFNPLMGGIAPAEAWRMLKTFESKVKPYLPN
ncbi:MAG: LLM class flavin-dependent oxidoreductase [Steroidobacteraceae bacterium]|jgi:alkanesulfonate monooxygenase SsuD/methylene tetrahydromethanopterin reductase-like flavin-dependent oxidoreductase (luciferase family)|nr:LLM class flavin-dependent oxidoreductase [Steroidobacteraceae bacterium]